MKGKLDKIVGVFGIVGLVYVAVLFIVHMLQRYKGTDVLLLRFSKLALFASVLALLCVLLTYYSPFLGSNTCQCELLWKLSLILFITSLYGVKFMYIARVYIYFKGPSTDGIFNGKVPISVFALVISMSMCFIANIVSQFITVTGECHINVNQRGCLTGFQNGNVYIAFCMIAIDITLFCWYSNHWSNKIRYIIKHSPKSLEQSNQQVLRSFKIQLYLITAALATTAIDGILHLIIKQYYALSIYVIDIVMAATANALGFTKVRVWLYNTLIACEWAKKFKKSNNTSNEPGNANKSDNPITSNEANDGNDAESPKLNMKVPSNTVTEPASNIEVINPNDTNNPASLDVVTDADGENRTNATDISN